MRDFQQDSVCSVSRDEQLVHEGLSAGMAAQLLGLGVAEFSGFRCLGWVWPLWAVGLCPLELARVVLNDNSHNTQGLTATVQECPYLNYTELATETQSFDSSRMHIGS